jgi:hypothetical protein
LSNADVGVIDVAALVVAEGIGDAVVNDCTAPYPLPYPFDAIAQ